MRSLALLLLVAAPVQARPPLYSLGPQHPFGCCYPAGSFVYGRCPWYPAYDPAVEALRHLRRGLLMMQSYELADAEFALRDSLRQKADLAVTHFWLGHVLQELDRPKEAVEAYRDALSWDFREPAVARNNLGTALAELGRWPEAAEEYRRALQVSPRFEKAKENLALAGPRAVLAHKLTAILDGTEKPASAMERVALAEIAHSRGLFSTALELWTAAFQQDGRLIEGQRYHAAGSAARVRTEQARSDAYRWLSAELLALEVAFKAREIERVRQSLFHWRRNPDFHYLRSFDGLFGLPDRERAAWKKLWTDADVLLARADQLPSGRWRIEGKDLVQTEEAKPPRPAVLYLGDVDWRDYWVEAEVSSPGTVSLCLRVRDAGTQVVVRLGQGGVEVLAQKDGAPLLLLGRDDSLTLTPERWHKLRVQVLGSRFRLWLDDRAMPAFTVEGFPRGRVGLRTEGSSARWRTLRVVESVGDVLFEGLPRLP